MAEIPRINFNGNTLTVNQALLERQALDSRYLTIQATLTGIEGAWMTVSCFERLWRWLLSCFGVSSTIEKCKRVSLEAFQIVKKPYFAIIQSIAGIEGTLQNRLVGTLFAQAVGDAIGVTTEFMDKKSAQKVIALGPLEYSTRHSTAEFKKIESQNIDNRYEWRLNFPFQGWTDDTDQAFCIIRALVKAESNSSYKTAPQLFAFGLKDWIDYGLTGRDFSAQEGGREKPSFNKPTALGLGGVVGTVMGVLPQRNTKLMQRFANDPKECAIEGWNNPKLAFGGDKPAANGALMRSAPIAAFYSNDYAKMIENTVEMCEVTHVDPRCVASCVAANTAIFHMIHGETDLKIIREKAFGAAVDILAKKCLERGVNNALQKKHEGELQQMIYSNNFEKLNLDDNGNCRAIGGTFQCLGAAFGALSIADKYFRESNSSESSFRSAITALVGEGGDADTNSAIASAMLGARWGFAAIPESWKSLRDQEVLLEMVKAIKIPSL